MIFVNDLDNLALVRVRIIFQTTRKIRGRLYRNPKARATTLLRTPAIQRSERAALLTKVSFRAPLPSPPQSLRYSFPLTAFSMSSFPFAIVNFHYYKSCLTVSFGCNGKVDNARETSDRRFCSLLKISFFYSGPPPHLQRNTNANVYEMLAQRPLRKPNRRPEFGAASVAPRGLAQTTRRTCGTGRLCDGECGQEKGRPKAPFFRRERRLKSRSRSQA